MEKSIDEICKLTFWAAKKYEQSNTGCAQSALAGIFDALGKSDDLLFRSISGLADGLGLSTRGSCGALTAGALAIGMIFGRTREDFNDPLAAMDSYDLVLDLVDKFEEKVGAIRCCDIQKLKAGRSYNLRFPADMQAALDDDMLDHCSTVVGIAAEQAVRIILEES